MGLFNWGKNKEKNLKPIEKKNNALTQNKELSVRGLTIHDDLKDLVWIADGNFKNYNQSKNDVNSFEVNGFRISISFQNQEEPSLIYTNQKISQPEDISTVERPSYFPTYTELSPEQKWVYLNLLSNPCNSAIDIGFVFILYYGLERHLLSGNFEKAISVILKLRDVHKNKSFQSYSANAVVLSCMMHQRGDLVLDFINSLDKGHELVFSDNLFLICYYSFDIPIIPKDVMRMASTFEFNNKNYIKKYPELFLEKLSTEVISKLGTDKIDLKNYLTAAEIKKVNQENVAIFANMSIIDKSISIPLLANSFKLKREMYNFLEISHENVKKELAEMRKTGKLKPEVNKSEKPKKNRVAEEIDYNQIEQDLLKSIEETEKDSKKTQMGVIPAYYEQLAKLYRKMKEKDKEIDILERFAKQIHARGKKPAILLERLEKLKS